MDRQVDSNTPQDTVEPLPHSEERFRALTDQLKQLEAQLAASERMASVGILAAGVAHEINNPLAAVVANLELLAQGLTALESGTAGARALAELREPLADARMAAERVRHVVRDLRMFSKPQDERRGPVDLRLVLESTLRMASNEIRHRAHVVEEYGEVPFVLASDSRLGQVFLNLLVNAAQAIREGDAARNEIRITTRTDEEGWAVVEVSDNGCGICPDALKRLFEPFFTTKPAGLGTGLGLSICRRILQELGGTITVESAAGKGTAFLVRLPPGRPDLKQLPVPRRALSRPMRRGRVLVIDDEVLMARVVGRTLAPEHDVTTACSAAEELGKLCGGARYDVILCDLMMPQMTGMDFYDALLRQLPDQAARVVFFTGGTFTSEAKEFLDRVPNQRMEKPFDVTGLRELINDCIASGPARDGRGIAA